MYLYVHINKSTLKKAMNKAVKSPLFMLMLSLDSQSQCFLLLATLFFWSLKKEFRGDTHCKVQKIDRTYFRL